MRVKGSFCVLFLVLALFLLSSFTTARKEDPELRTCKHQCRVQRQYDERQKQKCEEQCEDYIKEKQGRETGKQRGDEDEDDDRTDKWAVNKDKSEKQSSKRQQGKSRGDEEEGDEERENPYVFNEDDFETLFQTEFGSDRVLPKFTKLSNHLKGIKNYRVEIFEANPMTFLQPTHSDDDGFFFVANGKGTITLVTSDNRESFNIQQGHIMKIPAGTTVYLINRDNEEKLVIVKLIQPINNAGESVAFFGAGGRNPESFLNAFSPEVVEALFKVPRDKSESLFGKQGQGIVTRASKEQIRALSKEEGDEGYWPFGGGKSRTSNGPFDIFKKRPLQKNEFGRLIEVDSEDLRQLSDLNMKVSFANITQGGMHTLYYNTRATKIAVVTNGKGKFQMACPHISAEGKQNKHQKEEKSIVHYQTVNGVLRSGTVFVVPAGHPFVTVASKKDNLEVICFEVNAEDNERIPLAGRKSLFKQFEREAKELAFEVKAEVLDEFLEKQEEEFFFEGPRRRKERETGRSDE